MTRYSPIHRATPKAPTLLPRIVEGCAFLFYISLIYKMDGIGVVCLLVLCGCALFLPVFRKFMVSKLAVASILYVAMATVTAFLVSPGEGFYRTAQFVILVLATAVIAVYFTNVSPARRELLIRRFAILTAVIFGHMVLYHLATGHLTTWKYLYDTKSVLSISVILIFFYEDGITLKFGRVAFYAVILLLFILLMISGERKAYILFAVVYLFSREALAVKLGIMVIGAVALATLAALAPPDSYVARQVESLVKEKREMQIGEFYGIENIGDQSDIIRDFVNRMAWEQFKEHPVLGLGGTGYQVWSKANFGLATDSRGLAMNVHGEIHRVPAEGGVVGIAVAVMFYGLLILAVGRDFLYRVKRQISSSSRAPLYVLSFLLTYASVEALDTFMLELILLFGFVMAARLSSMGKTAASGRNHNLPPQRSRRRFHLA